MHSIKSEQRRLRWLAPFLFAVFYLHASPALALLNPSSAYCEALGYDYLRGRTPRGKDIVGLCKTPDGTYWDAWAFYLGEVGLEWSYCVTQGYEAKHVEDDTTCRSCMVCVMPGGEEVPVAQVMGLGFRESACGDRQCGTMENIGNCPSDCPSGIYDEYCDGMADGVCDRDCVDQEESDPDCVTPSSGCECSVREDQRDLGSVALWLFVGLAFIARRALRRRQTH